MSLPTFALIPRFIVFTLNRIADIRIPLSDGAEHDSNVSQQAKRSPGQSYTQKRLGN
jgi:hypothetical protein